MTPRAILAWPLYWLGRLFYRAGTRLMVASHHVQGPGSVGPWNEVFRP